MATVISLPWFGPRLFGLQAQLGARAFRQAAEAGYPETLSLAGVTFYPRMLLQQFGVGASLLFALGLVVAAWRRQWLMLGTLLGPFFVLSVLIQNKNLRFTLPLLGVMAVIAALALTTLPRGVRRGRRVALLAPRCASRSRDCRRGAAERPPAGLGRVVGAGLAARCEADWQHAKILALLEQDRRGAPATVSVVPNDNFFAVSNFRYYAVRDRLDLRFVRAWDDPPLGIDYMILKTGSVGPQWTAEKAIRVSERLARDPALARVFPVIGEFPLPDGSTATVRARRRAAGGRGPGGGRGRGGGARCAVGWATWCATSRGCEIDVAYDDAIRAGRIGRVEIRMAAATFGEFARGRTPTLRVRDIQVVIEDFLVNPWSALEGRLDPLDAGRVRFESATLALADLQAYIAALPRLRGVGGGRRWRCVAGHRAPGRTRRQRARAAAARGRPAVRAGGRARAGRSGARARRAGELGHPQLRSVRADRGAAAVSDRARSHQRER